MDQQRMLENLRRSCEIINAAFALKLALVRSRHPELNPDAAERMVYEGILRRKEKEWTSRAG